MRPCRGILSVEQEIWIVSKEAVRKIPRNIVVLGVVSLLTDAASEMIYPLIPVFVAALGSGALILGVIEGVAETTAALLKLFSGVLSDRMARRKLLVGVGYTISSLVRPFTGVVSAAWHIVLVRMTDRVGKGIRTAPRDALIAASADADRRGRAFGFHRAMDHAGAVLGPLLAVLAMTVLVIGFGMTDTLAVLRRTFILAAVPGLLAVAAVWGLVRENVADLPPAGKRSFSLRPFGRNFTVYLAVLLLFTLGNSSDAFLLFRVQEAARNGSGLASRFSGLPLVGDMLGRLADPAAREMLAGILFLSLLWSFFHVIKAFFSTPLAGWSDTLGRKRVILIGWVIYAAVYLGFAFLDRLPGSLQIAATIALFAVYALYYAFTEGAEKALVADLVGPEMRGSAFGLYNFTIGLGALPASLIFGLLYQKFGAATAFGAGAGLAFVSMLLLAVFVRERKAGGPDPI
jgi:MFS family permease